MTANRQLCTFLLDGLLFGVEVMSVQEVIRFQDTTNIPLASSMVRGLINLRGQIVTALDLRRRLALPDRAETDPPPVNVVLLTDDGAVSLLADEVGDVLTVSNSDFELPPGTLRGEARELIRGAYKLPDRLLLILDPDRAVTLPPTDRRD